MPSQLTRTLNKQVAAALVCRRGTTAIEYCLIAIGVAVVIVAAVSAIGTNLTTIFTSVEGGLTN
jgi:pilus assembly protein Flp/PilA